MLGTNIEIEIVFAAKWKIIMNSSSFSIHILTQRHGINVLDQSGECNC